MGLSRKPADHQKLSIFDERLIINFCDKNAVTERFRDNNDVFNFLPRNVMICHDFSCSVMMCQDMYDKNVANLFYR